MKGSESLNYQITVSGCDDLTSVQMLLSREESALITRLANLITQASSYECMPRMRIEPAPPPEQDTADPDATQEIEMDEATAYRMAVAKERSDG